MGIIAPVLAEHIEFARGLVQDARVLTRQLEFVCWRGTLSGWRRTCVHTLLCEFEQEAVAEFLRATRTREQSCGSWQSALREDLRLLDDAIELLVALRNSLSARGRAGHRVLETHRQVGWATETPT